MVNSLRAEDAQWYNMELASAPYGLVQQTLVLVIY